jgi:hypothetical protein
MKTPKISYKTLARKIVVELGREWPPEDFETFLVQNAGLRLRARNHQAQTAYKAAYMQRVGLVRKAAAGLGSPYCLVYDRSSDMWKAQTPQAWAASDDTTTRIVGYVDRKIENRKVFVRATETAKISPCLAAQVEYTGGELGKIQGFVERIAGHVDLRLNQAKAQLALPEHKKVA